jgi:SRSO17 transposase
VEVVVSDGWSAAPVGGRLYLPESWTKGRARGERAGVPEDIEFATKPMIALQLIRQALADGVARAGFGDAAYDDNAEFRAGLRAFDLEFFLQVDAAKHKGWSFEAPTEMKQVRRHPRDDAPPSQTLAEIAVGIPAEQWQSAQWEPPMENAAQPVWLGARCGCNTHLAKLAANSKKLWLVVDWPVDSAEPYHYYLARLHARPPRRDAWHSAAVDGASSNIFQRGKDDLGFDHFEGRSWTGFHYRLVLSALAYLFILNVHARAKKTSGATWQQTLRSIRPWLVGSIGSCFYCGGKFEDIVVSLT